MEHGLQLLLVARIAHRIREQVMISRPALRSRPPVLARSLARIHQPDRDHHVETVVTIAAPFFVFYVAETAFGESFQMSGVLAVVAFGLVYASPWGSIRVDPRAVHFLHEFWGMVGHIVNLIIFVMAGIMILLKIGNTERATLAIDMGLGLLGGESSQRREMSSGEQRELLCGGTGFLWTVVNVEPVDGRGNPRRCYNGSRACQVQTRRRNGWAQVAVEEDHLFARVGAG